MQEDIGNYVSTGQVIGRGTFSTVYLGLEKESKRKVAIKVRRFSVLSFFFSALLNSARPCIPRR